MLEVGIPGGQVKKKDVMQRRQADMESAIRDVQLVCLMVSGELEKQNLFVLYGLLCMYVCMYIHNNYVCMRIVCLCVNWYNCTRVKYYYLRM